MNWEEIEIGLFRAKVPGGWLVKLMEDIHEEYPRNSGNYNCGWNWRPALTFVPDPLNLWKIN